MKIGIVAACLLLSGCAAHAATRPTPRTVTRYFFPPEAKDGDLFCVGMFPEQRCRLVGEVRQFVQALNAAP